MYELNRKEFGERLKLYRKKFKLTQVEMATMLHIERSNLSRYENGETMPSIENIIDLCNRLEITIEDLITYKSEGEENTNIDSINPFDSNVLYAYYLSSTSDDGKAKFRFNIVEKKDRIQVEWCNLKNTKIYMTGTLIANDDVAFIIFKNNEEFNPQLEITEVIINLRYSSDGVYHGSIHGNLDGYQQVAMKIMVSKNDIEFTDNMKEEVKATRKEMLQMSEDGYWMIDSNNKKGYYD